MRRIRIMRNRMSSIGLVLLGIINAILEYDITFLVLSLLLGVPLYFTKDEPKKLGSHKIHML